MSGRRSHPRFTISPASEGVLRILTDVVVQQSDNNELVAISREPGIVGEVLAAQIMSWQGIMHTAVRVAESRPLVSEGTIRHRLRLERVQPFEAEI
jgi:hypothetical protein